MSLTKEDLSQIKKIVEVSEKRLTGKMKDTETIIRGDLTKKILDTKEEILEITDRQKNEILEVLGQEVSDLADINRAVITRYDEMDYRLKIVERKLGVR